MSCTSTTQYIVGYSTEASTGRTCGACSLTGGVNVIIPDDFLGTHNICMAVTNLAAAPTTNYATRVARVKYLGDNWADYQVLTTATTGMMLVAINTPAVPTLELASANPTTPSPPPPTSNRDSPPSTPPPFGPPSSSTGVSPSSPRSPCPPAALRGIPTAPWPSP